MLFISVFFSKDQNNFVLLTNSTNIFLANTQYSLEQCIIAGALDVFSLTRNKAVILYSHRQLFHDAGNVQIHDRRDSL